MELVKTKGTPNKPHCGFLFFWRLFVQPQSLKLAIIRSYIYGYAIEPTLITLIPKKIRNIFSKDDREAPLQIIPRDQHNISRSNISEPALKVLYRLRKAGYEAFLVGGGVRDSLLGLNPTDFDVTTNATPEQLNSLFRNSRLIGRRFRLVHVIRRREVIEVATFRATPKENASNNTANASDRSMVVRDNVDGSQDKAAMRSDFTINVFYYHL